MTILVPKNSVFHSIRPDDVTMTSNLLELTNFPGCGTTENEIYIKFCLRKSLLEKDSIVHKFLPKPGRICRDFCCRGHRRLKKTTGVFSRYLHPSPMHNPGTCAPHPYPQLAVTGSPLDNRNKMFQGKGREAVRYGSQAKRVLLFFQKGKPPWTPLYYIHPPPHAIAIYMDASISV